VNKKKIIWGIVIFLIFAIIVWIDIPYVFSSKNLISKNNYDYTYKRVSAIDLNYVEGSIWIYNTEDGDVDKLISIIDELSFKKARRPKNWSEYRLNFMATYEEDEYTSFTTDVFSITFYEDNVIGFREQDQYKEKYYKIQDKKFDIKKIIKELH
jgi:hypothetical protein